MSPKVRRMFEEASSELSTAERRELADLLLSLDEDDPGEPDDLDDEDRARLHEALQESLAQSRRGEVIPAEQALASIGIRSKWG
jgi:hypothetical protein